MKAPYLGWFGIFRLGLVQTGLGAIVVLATSIMNRIMVVELALPAVIPGALVALHYTVQLLRPRLGHGSDLNGKRSRFILAGVIVLGLGANIAALSTDLMRSHFAPGLALAVLGFSLIGVGVGMAGTCLLVLLAKRTRPEQRPAAATVVWLMMIAGFVVATIAAGQALQPFTYPRLMEVTSVTSIAALIISSLALIGIDAGDANERDVDEQTTKIRVPFRIALEQVWQEAPTRQLAVFIFVSMLAYSSEELILDPFAGSVYGFTPGQSTQLSGALHGGVFAGMLIAAVLASVPRLMHLLTMQRLMISGCVLSGLALMGLAGAGFAAPAWPLRMNVFALGFANGVFAVSALGAMMSRASFGNPCREGVRMGLWGAAQGVAFGCGGVIAAGASDLARVLLERRGPAYGLVFLLESALFVCAALIARRMQGEPRSARYVSEFQTSATWSLQ